MIGPEVQGAIVAALKGGPAIAGGNIYDRVPDGATFPMVTIGQEQVLDAGNTCSEGWEVFSDIHVWSRAPGRVEAKRLIAAIVPRLNAIAAIDGHTMLSVNVEGTRILDDPDGLTTHGVITVKLIIDPA